MNQTHNQTENLRKAGDARADKAHKRLKDALQHPTIHDAVTAYGATEASFWRACTRHGYTLAARAKYKTELDARKAAARAAFVEGGKAAAAQTSRIMEQKAADFVEDAEFIAHHGETIEGALPRLNVPTEEALRRRLERYGRSDILTRLLTNSQNGHVPQGRVH